MALAYDFEHHPVEQEEFYFTREGVAKLKQMIDAYWNERGFDPECEIVQTHFNKQLRTVRYDLRSNLKNGIPQKKLPTLVACIAQNG